MRRLARDGDPVSGRRRQHGDRDTIVPETTSGVRVPFELRLWYDGSRLAEE